MCVYPTLVWEKQTKRSAKEIKAGHVNITPVMPGITHSLTHSKLIPSQTLLPPTTKDKKAKTVCTRNAPQKSRQNSTTFRSGPNEPMFL